MIIALILAVWLIGVPVAVLTVGALCQWRTGRARGHERSPAASPVVIVVGRTGSLVPRRTRPDLGCETRRPAAPTAAYWLRHPRRV